MQNIGQFQQAYKETVTKLVPAQLDNVKGEAITGIKASSLALAETIVKSTPEGAGRMIALNGVVATALTATGAVLGFAGNA